MIPPDLLDDDQSWVLGARFATDVAFFFVAAFVSGGGSGILLACLFGGGGAFVASLRYRDILVRLALHVDPFVAERDRNRARAVVSETARG